MSDHQEPNSKKEREEWRYNQDDLAGSVIRELRRKLACINEEKKIYEDYCRQLKHELTRLREENKRLRNKIVSIQQK